MTEQKPHYEQALCYTAQEDRLLIKNYVAIEGVADVAGGSLAVTSSGAGLSLAINTGGAFLDGADFPGAPAGMYSVRNEGAVTLAAAANSSGFPRIDLVVASVYDSQYSGVDDNWAIEIIPGVATTGATLANKNGAQALSTTRPQIALAYVLVPDGFAGPFVNATHILDVRNQYKASATVGFPYVKLEAAAATTLPTNTSTTIALATVVANDAAYFDVTASVITIKQTGLYDLSGFVETANPTNSLSDVAILSQSLAGVYKNEARGRIVVGSGTSLNFGSTLSATSVILTAGTSVSLRAQQAGVATPTTHVTTGSAASPVVISRLVVRKVG